jgi:hypothetical protein
MKALLLNRPRRRIMCFLPFDGSNVFGQTKLVKAKKNFTDWSIDHLHTIRFEIE